jgi:5'-nucleotidase/UDP-sugar diphosphatase
VGFIGTLGDYHYSLSYGASGRREASHHPSYQRSSFPPSGLFAEYRLQPFKDGHRIAVNLFNATFINFVGRFTYGILKVVPKDRHGNPIVTKSSKGNPFDILLPLRVDTDKEKPGIQELKEWVCAMDYVKSFPDRDGDGSPDMPEKYRDRLGRIMREPSWNPVSLLSKGTYLTWAAFGVVIVLFLALPLGMYLFARRIRKR